MGWDSIKVEHNGQTIVFSEHRDVWYCENLSMEDPSLAKLKKKIAAYDLNLRKLTPVKALRIWHSHYDDVSPAEITSIADDQHVWATIKGRGSSKSRSKEQIRFMAHDTPQVRDILKRAGDLGKQAEKLNQEASNLIESIPRITIEELRENAELRQQTAAEGGAE